MGIGDKIVKWWVQNMYASKMIKYEPGFIVTEFNNQYGDVLQRIITFPENIIVEIEKEVIERLGDDGKSLLKKIGRDYGYNYAFSFDAPKLSKKGEEFVSKYIQFSANYGFSSFAKDAKMTTFDISDGKFVYEYDDHVVCRKNGIGLLLTEYVVNGSLEFVLEYQLDVKTSTCQGRGDNLCTIEYIKKEHEPCSVVYNKHNKIKYKHYNSIKPPRFSSNSTSIMIKNKILKVEDGMFSIKGETTINLEILFLYLLEKEMNLKGVGELLFSIGFKWGKFFSKSQNSTNFIQDIFSGFGYGDILIKFGQNTSITFDNFPWTPLIDEIEDFKLLRGICSGMLSEIKLREIELKETKIYTSGGNLSIVLS